MDTSIDAALSQHLGLAEQLRSQLLELQKSLESPEEGTPPAAPQAARTALEKNRAARADGERAKLMSLARVLSDKQHLQQLCDLAEQLQAKEHTGAAARSAPPARPAPAPTLNAVSVQFGAMAGKLGISFESASNADPPHIKAIAADGAAAVFPELKTGLLLAAIQGQSVAGMSTKQAIAAIKSAGRPLTLDFNHSAQSMFTTASTAGAQKDGSDDDDSDEDDDTPVRSVPAPAPAAAAPRELVPAPKSWLEGRDPGALGAPAPAAAQTPAATPELVAVTFYGPGKLGISFGSDSLNGAAPVKITRVTDGGLASADSRLKVNNVDFLLKCLDFVLNMFDFVFKMLGFAARPVYLGHPGH